MLNIRAYVLVILFAIGLFAVGIVGIRSGWGVFSLLGRVLSIKMAPLLTKRDLQEPTTP